MRASADRFDAALERRRRAALLLDVRPARERAATAATTSAAGTSPSTTRCPGCSPCCRVRPPPPPPPPADPVANGGFETAGLAPWACQGNCGADHGAGLARTGTGNGWVRNTSGWNDVHQTIARARPTAPTRSRAWMRTSANNADGYFGLRTTGGQVLGEQRFGRFDGYTKLTVDGEHRRQHERSCSTPGCGPTATPGSRSTTSPPPQSEVPQRSLAAGQAGLGVGRAGGPGS